MIKWTFDKVQAWATRGFKDNYSKLPNQASITFRQDTRGIFTFGRNVAKAISPMVLIGRIRSTDTSLTSLLDIYARVEGESEVVIGLTEYFVGLYSIFDVGHIDLMEPFAKISKGSADSDRPALLALRIGFIVYYYLIAAGYLGTIPSQIVCRYQDRDYHTFTVSGDFDVEFKVACAVIAASSTVQNNTRDANQKRTIDFDNSGSKDGWRKQMARNLSGNSYIFGELESSSQAPAAPKRRKVNTETQGIGSISPRVESNEDCERTKQKETTCDVAYYQKQIENYYAKLEKDNEELRNKASAITDLKLIITHLERERAEHEQTIQTLRSQCDEKQQVVTKLQTTIAPLEDAKTRAETAEKKLEEFPSKVQNAVKTALAELFNHTSG